VTIKVLLEVDSRGQITIGTPAYEVVSDGRDAPLARFDLSLEDLEYIVTHGAGLLGKTVAEDFDSSKLPTHEQLVDAADQSSKGHPFEHLLGFPRFLQTLATLRSYIAWLPMSHQHSVKLEVDFLERRVEELAHIRQFVASLKKFGLEQMRPDTSAQMFYEATMFVRHLNELVGIDLWDDYAETTWR